MSRLKVYFDGGLRPEGMETAVVIRGQAHVRRDLGPGTSMDAEWLALLHAVELTRAIGWDAVVLIGDSAAVVAQANGRVRARGGDARHHAAFVAATATEKDAAGPGPRVRYVKRAQNLAGGVLARLHER